ncbi:hypothetical protein [Acidianus sp. HS-5]|uniref:hypothetical protein n=1 Tax=Acidianus sp. HS-5 TaxID=2886040 RepID=UPI001F273096|nr:hypothetical protein [Acidianus sp. HS-5]BDC18414.1 hypothetical protein HS5_13040 [Acidianus sp. HS-5]
MNPLSLRKLLDSPLKKDAEDVINYCNTNELVPILSFYLEEELLNNLVKSLEREFSPLYSDYKFNKTFFIKKVKEKFGNGKEYEEFPYYLVPIGESNKVIIVNNNNVPPKAVPIEGKFRLTFIIHHSFDELNQYILSQSDDDIIVEFKNSELVNIEKKRNIFMDSRSVEKIEESKLFKSNLIIPESKNLLLISVISNNVFPYNNILTVNIEDGNKVEININGGKASEDDVINGKALTFEEKAKIYFEYKQKQIIKDEILKGIIWKLSQ